MTGGRSKCGSSVGPESWPWHASNVTHCSSHQRRREGTSCGCVLVISGAARHSGWSKERICLPQNADRQGRQQQGKSRGHLLGWFSGSVPWLVLWNEMFAGHHKSSVRGFQAHLSWQCVHMSIGGCPTINKGPPSADPCSGWSFPCCHTHIFPGSATSRRYRKGKSDGNILASSLHFPLEPHPASPLLQSSVTLMSRWEVLPHTASRKMKAINTEQERMLRQETCAKHLNS